MNSEERIKKLISIIASIESIICWGNSADNYLVYFTTGWISSFYFVKDKSDFSDIFITGSIW